MNSEAVTSFISSPLATPRLLFTGPFAAGQAECARDELCAAIRAGARDVLYVVSGAAAKRGVIQGLIRRECAVFGVHVVTLAGLPREIERRARVALPPVVDALARELLAERATREACAGIFPTSAPIEGLARQVVSTIDLLERSGARPESLEAELRALGEQGEASRMLLAAWRSMTGLQREHGRTQAEAVGDAVRLLRDHPGALAECDVLVLENLRLDLALDRELVAATIGAARGAVIASCEAPPQLAGTSAARSLVGLRAMTPWDERICAPAATRFRHAVGRVFAAAGAVEEEAGTPEGTEVRLLETAGDVGEVRLAARVIRRHLGAGVEPDEIQVVLRSPGRYPRLIEEIFASEGIPVAMARGRSVAESGIGDVLERLLRAALAPDECGREESLALLRTPHVALAGWRADRFEHWVRRRGYLGFAGWGELDPEKVDERTMRRVARFRGVLLHSHEELLALRGAEQAAGVARRIARDLRLLGNAHFARLRTVRAGGEDPGLRSLAESAIREDNQAWEAIEEILDRMPELLGLAGVSAGLSGRALAERWLAVLSTAFRGTDIGFTPPSAGAVRVVGVGEACTRPGRVALVLGLLEKRFPRQARQDVFLHDELRVALRSRTGWHLPLMEEQAEQEREHFLRALCSASEVLYLSCTATDADGRPTLRSFFLRDLERVHPIPPPERVGISDLTAPLADAKGPADLLAALAHDLWQHLPAAPPYELRRAAAFHAHDQVTAAELDLGPVRGRRRHEMRPALASELLENAPHRTLRLSASQLGTIARCTYQHFVDKVLAPEDLEEPAYDALSRGSLLHDAIMHWSTELRGWDRGEAALEEIDRWVAERVAGWPPSMRQYPSARHAAEASRERLGEFLREELALVRVVGGPDSATPAYHELAFGEQAEGAGRRDPASVADAFPFSTATSAGMVTAHFRGSIDRVDVFEVDGRRYGVAIDYKTGRTSKHYAKEMHDGHDLQLRLYLLALEHFWGIVPVGALYIGFGDGVRRGAIREGFERFIPGLGLGAEVKRLDEANWAAFVGPDTTERIRALVDRLVRLDIQAAPRDGDCGFCSHQPICRYDRFALQETHA